MNTQTVWYEKLLQFLKQYKLAGVFLLLGVCLMVLPGMRKEPLQETPQETLVYDLQLQMEQLLEHVDGAGSVKVLLSWKTFSPRYTGTIDYPRCFPPQMKQNMSLTTCFKK